MLVGVVEGSSRLLNEEWADSRRSAKEGTLEGHGCGLDAEGRY